MSGARCMVGIAVRLGWPLPAAVAMALALCAVYGAIVERLAVRPFVRRGSNAWLMATVALGILADNAVLFTFGKEPRGFPMPWATGAIEVEGRVEATEEVVLRGGAVMRGDVDAEILLVDEGARFFANWLRGERHSGPRILSTVKPSGTA